MRVAVFPGAFPALSETFIVRQITGLIDLGHRVDIYAERRAPSNAPLQPDVVAYGLLRRTRYIDIPAASGYWEMPVRPFTGQTWLPGAEKPIPNAARLVKAAPVLVRSAWRAPKLTREVLDPSQYAYQAESLSALYRLSGLSAYGMKGRYSVLHMHFGPVANSFRFAKELWRAPLVVSFHGYDFSSWPRKHGATVYKKLFRTTEAVTVSSDHAWNRLEALGCPLAKLYKLPVGLDLAQFPYTNRMPCAGGAVRILTVGRLVEKKGLEYSIRAVGALLEDFPRLHYDIIGEGPLLSQLEALVQSLGAADRITLHGAKDQSAVRQAMKQAHLFVLASVTAADGDQEGQGLVLQEAQAVGLPVIATLHNGFAESIVPGVSGFLVPERSVEALTERIRFLLEHPESWQQMGAAGRAYVEAHYDIRHLSRRLADLYSEVSSRYTRGKARA